MKQQVFINQKENTVYSTDKIKYKVFSGDFEKFKDLYHQYYLCFHCGHTYNDKKDVRVTLVNNLKKQFQSAASSSFRNPSVRDSAS